MFETDFSGYARIVGEFKQDEYLGPEQQGELLRRCTILENVEIGYSSNTCLKESESVN